MERVKKEKDLSIKHLYFGVKMKLFIGRIEGIGRYVRSVGLRT